MTRLASKCSKCLKQRYKTQLPIISSVLNSHFSTIYFHSFDQYCVQNKIKSETVFKEKHDMSCYKTTSIRLDWSNTKPHS